VNAPPVPDRTPRDYTPRHLADAILRSRSALEGERKQVTVLFADVKDSTELSQRVGLEDLHRIMDRFLRILARGVHRFEGTVNQYTGDGVMALFGAPIAHEDHAQRACHAALHLREELRHYSDELRLGGLDFSIRMGMNSGEVVVGRIGDDLRMDYTAQGPTVNLAARMEQIAGPDRVYLTEHCARFVEGYFRLRGLGPLAVKGVAEPVRVYELEGTGPLRTRLDASRALGLSRFVGRAREMAVLFEALDLTLKGEGQSVAIVADPGTGKSRLVHEFLERCRARGVGTFVTNCPPHGRTIPLLPVIDHVRSVFDLSEQDDAEACRDKITGRMHRLGLVDDVETLLDFLGIPDPDSPTPHRDAGERARGVLAILTRLRERRTRERPSVNVWEDLHWIDSASETVVQELAPGWHDHALLSIQTFRPGYRPAWSELAHHRQLDLAPLGEAETRELLADLLGPAAQEAGLVSLVAERSRGNPFFIEEIVRSLAESGVLEGGQGAYRITRPVARIRVPDSVRAVLAARIDRLSETEKSILQAAAVIGKSVPLDLLERVLPHGELELEGGLAGLVEGRFLYEESVVPRIEYGFVHPLTQEVALHAQLSKQRRRLHDAVARALEALRGEGGDEKAALLAYHWDEAGQARAAAPWHRRAAEWAGERNARASVEHWRKVWSGAAGSDPSEREALRLAAAVGILSLVPAVALAEDEALALFQEGSEIARRRGDSAAQVRLQQGYGTRLLNAGDFETFRRHRAEAERLTSEVREPRHGFTLREYASFAAYVGGDLAGSLRLWDEAAEIVRQEPDVLGDPLCRRRFTVGQARISVALARQGRLKEATRAIDRAEELTRGHGDLVMETMVLWYGDLLAWFAGDLARAVEGVRRLAARGPDIDDLTSLRLRLGAGIAQLLSERFDEAASSFEEGLQMAQEAQLMLQGRPRWYAHLSEAYLGAGQLDPARRAADRALGYARESQNPVYLLDAELARARVLVQSEARSEAEASLARVARLLPETGCRLFEAFLALERGRLARRRGVRDLWQRELAQARRLFEQMGATGRAERVARELEDA
jgi:class 3 adenylate cyclase/tetratricopeptide (TPR) repeat protein